MCKGRQSEPSRLWSRLHLGLLAVLLAGHLTSCGEKREVIEVVEEEEQTGSTASGAPARKKSTKTKGGTGAVQTPEQGDTLAEPAVSGSGSVAPGTVASGATTPAASPPAQDSPQDPVVYAVAWEPEAVSSLVNRYCAGPCHGVHGKFASKDEFLSLKLKNLEQLKSGRMPPPRLFAGFRGSADEAALINWLDQQ